MNPVAKALWLIESGLQAEVTLERLAQVCGVSRFSLLRAFGAVTGCSVMSYLRARRLSEAARVLATGAPNILDVALDAGYGSHEAFTRAFREQFGLTPQALREQSHLNGITLMEPFRMDQQHFIDLEAPRFETSQPMLIAGLGERYTFDTNDGIPRQWQRFSPWIGRVPGEVKGVAYGVCCNGDGNDSFEYIAGVQVASTSGLPADFHHVQIPQRCYAVFTHRKHISTIRDTINAIWNKWLPESGFRHGNAPDFERYDQAFDPATGNGSFEIWVPIED